MNRLSFAVLAGFFISGATGLIYQNIWIRMLTLVVGGTTAALTTILIAFMGGLALGSWLFGAWADRTKDPLRGYAVVEAAIGLYALTVPVAYSAVPQIYQALHAVDPEHGPLFHSLRLLLALAFFGVPSTLMGGTLPLIVKALSKAFGSLQLTVATVYAVNTFGATLGAFMTGFVVIPSLGLDGTLWMTSGINFLLAGVFWFWLGPRVAALPDPPPVVEAVVEPTPSVAQAPMGGRALGRRPLLLVFFLMGASSLSYEILWSRLLSLSFGSSVYAISTMLTSFLLGIGLGSWWYRKRVGAAPTLATLGWLELGIAISGLFTVLVLIEMPWVVQYLYLLPWVFSQVLGPEASDLGFWFLQIGLFVLAAASMIVPTSLMGASFPIAIRLYADERVGTSVGRVYASNTFGSIVGSFITGFFLVEWVGTRAGLIGWSGLNLALGVGLLIVAARRHHSIGGWQKVAMAAAAVAALAVLVPARWNLDTLTSGVYYHVMGMDRGKDRGEVVFSAEDDMALVSLHSRSTWDEPDPIQVMRINGKFMADDGGRVRTLAMYSHTPLMLHGAAKNAMVIGLGGGYTAEAALRHSLEQVDVLEISGAVIEAAKVMNPALFENPRVRIVEEDARSFLLTGDTPYDVIISETSDPWITGVSNLYTEECFRWISARLAPGGVFGTWLQTRHKSVEDVQTILRTMNRVFPHMTAFQFGEGDTLLVMSNEPLQLNPQVIRERFDALEEPLGHIGVFDPWYIPGAMILGPASVAAYVGEGPINTDDLPIIEFTTPRTLNIGLKGKEVWDDLIAHAPQTPDLDSGVLTPEDRLLWKAYRQWWLGNDAAALDALRAARAAGAEVDAIFEGRLLLTLEQYEEALAVGMEASPSPRRSLLVAGCLTFLGRFGELEAWLASDEPWGQPTSRWERRIAQRRKVLLDGLGLGQSSN